MNATRKVNEYEKYEDAIAAARRYAEATGRNTTVYQVGSDLYRWQYADQPAESGMVVANVQPS